MGHPLTRCLVLIGVARALSVAGVRPFGVEVDDWVGIMISIRVPTGEQGCRALGALGGGGGRGGGGAGGGGGLDGMLPIRVRTRAFESLAEHGERVGLCPRCSVHQERPVSSPCWERRLALEILDETAVELPLLQEVLVGAGAFLCPPGF